LPLFTRLPPLEDQLVEISTKAQASKEVHLTQRIKWLQQKCTYRGNFMEHKLMSSNDDWAAEEAEGDDECMS